MKPRKEGGLAPCKLPLLTDITKQIAKDYGVLIDHGADNGVAFRGTFIIDPNGILRYAVVSDLNVGRSIDETVRVLSALKNGGLCPVEWEEGEATL